jgi:hypothetical protein
VIEILAVPFGPAFSHRFLAAAELVLPVRIEIARHDRRIMSPVLEQGSFILKQLPELILPERLVAGKQDLVVGALDGGNAVDLNETD